MCRTVDYSTPNRHCTATFSLGRGTITVQGFGPAGAKNFVFAVTGGTKDYAGVWGTVTMARTGPKGLRATKFDLSYPGDERPAATTFTALHSEGLDNQDDNYLFQKKEDGQTRVGDGFIITADLGRLDSGEDGYEAGVCTVTKVRKVNGKSVEDAQRCVTTFAFDTGQIVAVGPDPVDLKVRGGTGAYRGVHGTVSFGKRTEEASWTLKFKLT